MVCGESQDTQFAETLQTIGAGHFLRQDYYGQKKYVYQATNSLYHLAHFCCRTLQQNWVYSFKLSKNSKAG